MIDCYVICPGGQLREIKHNQERQGAHRCCRLDGKPAVKDEKTKEIVRVFENEEERERFFYDFTDNVDFGPQMLRESVKIEQGVTLGDVLDFIEKNDLLDTLAHVFSAYYPTLRDTKIADELADLLVITAQGQIRKGEFHFEYNLGWTNGRNWDRSTLVELSNEFPVFHEGEQVAKLIWEYSFIDLLVALFGGDDTDPCVFTKEGIKVNGVLVEDEDDALSALLRPVTLAEDLTFGDVFKFVEGQPLLKDIVGNYSWCWAIDEFHKQIKEKPPEDDRPLWHLEVYRSCDIHNGDSWLSLMPDFHAIGELAKDQEEWYKDRPEDKPDHTNYSVSCSHMGHLRDLPFVLNEEFVLRWLSRSYKTKKELTCRFGYRLLDFLEAIYWDISFYGGPTESQEFLDEMRGRIQEVKDAHERGEDITIPLEDVLKDLEEEEHETE